MSEMTLVEALTVLEMREAQVADYRGLLQGVLLSLEQAADALSPPGDCGRAADLVEDAIVAVRGGLPSADPGDDHE